MKELLRLFAAHRLFFWGFKKVLTWSLIASGILAEVLRTDGATATEQEIQVLPSGFENVAGNGFADPFFFTEVGLVTQMYRQSAFSLVPSGPISISSLAFRVDESSKGSLDIVVPDIRLTMAVSNGQVDPLNLINPVVVYDHQNVHLFASNPGANLGFDIQFPLLKPFVYDRSAGDLVLRFESHQTFGQGHSVDAQASADGVLFYYEPGPRLIAAGRMIVTSFTYTAVPEPHPSLIGLAAVVIFALAKSWFSTSSSASLRVTK